MGGMSTQSQQSQQGQGQQSAGGNQMNAANNVKINNKQAPSMGQMQEGMGGLLTLEGMNEAFQNFMSPMVNTVRNFQNEGTQQLLNQFDLNPAKTAFEQANNIEPVSQGNAFAETVAAQNAAREPEPVVEPVVEPVAEPVVEDNGWGDVKTDNDAINWALKKGDISQEDANWLRRWSSESVRRGRKENIWATGGGGAQTSSHSGLNSRNKAIAERFKNSIKGNWGDPKTIYAIEQGADFDGDGDVTNAEWKKHMDAGKKNKRPEEEEEEGAAIYNTKAARQIREAKLRALSQASI